MVELFAGVMGVLLVVAALVVWDYFRLRRPPHEAEQVHDD